MFRRQETSAELTGTTRTHPRRGSIPELRIEAGMATDPGCVRTINEDALRVIRPMTSDGLRRYGLLAVVCDGMGGHEGGEVASALAMETIIRRVHREGNDLPGGLVKAIRAANRAVYDSAKRNPKLAGMGTTCCALVLRGGLAYCAHVGDSRCYLIRGGDIFLMTEDHSAVMDMVRKGVLTREEARNHPDKNVISRALGSHRDVEVSTWAQPFTMQPDDAFLISSDGLHDLLSDEEIRDAVGSGSLHSQVVCDRLIAMARERGGPDNISVTVLRIRGDDSEAVPPGTTRTMEAAS